MRFRFPAVLALWLPCSLCSASLFPNERVAEHMALLGEAVVQASIEAPVIREPRRWMGATEGSYRYRYVAGDDHGETEQIERHRPDPANPRIAWTRHIGEALIEGVDIVDGQAIRLHTETDLEHGYRVEITPGITLPAGTRAGDSWASDNRLQVYELSAPERVAHTGSLKARRTYLGAYRVQVPAGTFDAVLIEEDYQLSVGPLHAEDTRYVFYARDVGVVAEVEGLRASALIVFRMSEDTAKVLVDYPTP